MVHSDFQFDMLQVPRQCGECLTLDTLSLW